MKTLIYAGLLSALATIPTQAEEIPRSKFSSGNWEGAAYTYTGSPQFSHCAVSVSFVSGDTLYFGVNADATVTVGVASENFRLRPPETFPVSLFVDRRQPFRATATAVEETFAILTIEDFQGAMDAFGRGRTLRMESALTTGHYDLTGSFRALEAARQCAIFELTREAANPPPKAPPPAVAPPPAGSLPPPRGSLPPPSGTTGN